MEAAAPPVAEPAMEPSDADEATEGERTPAEGAAAEPPHVGAAAAAPAADGGDNSGGDNSSDDGRFPGDDVAPVGAAERDDPDPAAVGGTPCLLCAQCMAVVAAPEHIIRTPHSDRLDSAVYTYEIDILEEDCSCYSATNPGDVRFDVVRVRYGNGAHAIPHRISDRGCGAEWVWRGEEGATRTDMQRGLLRGAGTRDGQMGSGGGYTVEHSWFPPFGWVMVECLGAGNGCSLSLALSIVFFLVAVLSLSRQNVLC